MSAVPALDAGLALVDFYNQVAMILKDLLEALAPPPDSLFSLGMEGLRRADWAAGGLAIADP